jgi:hypothetical protein
VNPDVVDAIATLERQGVLDSTRARRFSRVAGRELVSLHAELRFLAYTGVVLVMGGVGLLVKENLERIGPVTIAVALAMAALGGFAWVVRHAAPFTRAAASSAHLAFDYVLLLAALLAAADLAYLEAQFTPLGPAWSWHLLIVSAFYAVLAFRYDSRVVFSLALSTFAAWRGVSAGQLEHTLWGGPAGSGYVRLNAVGCGVLFVMLGAVLKRNDWKAHFEPAAVHVGCLLVLSALASALAESRMDAQAYGFVLFVVGGALAGYGLYARRLWLLAMGVVGAYVGLSAVVLSAADNGEFAVYWFAFTGLCVLPALFLLHRVVKERV